MTELFNINITATKDTYLKKSTLSSSKLPANEKSFVKKGRTYAVKSYKKIDGKHDYVELDYDAGNWHIFEEHWDVDWERDEEEGKYKPVGLQNTITIVRNDPNLWKNNANKISKYFTVGEVTQYDSRRIPKKNSKYEKNIFLLADELDKLREHCGPLTVTSWYRPPAINRAVGGVSNSKHILGIAADIRPANGNKYTLFDLQRFCLENWRGGVGKGMHRGFVHLDGRDGFPCYKAGTPTAIWNY